MNDRWERGLPARLEKLRERLDKWRAAHAARSRLPDELWASAVKMVGTFGLHRTAKMLRLEYYSLKKRVEQHSTIRANPPRKVAGRRRSVTPFHVSSAPTFVELSPVADRCECTLELEDAIGSKMRVHLKGVGTPDLAALACSFWNPRP